MSLAEPYEIFKIRFTQVANGMAWYYGAPVWLTGSALYKEHPRDYDIRIILEDHDYHRLFGTDKVVPADKMISPQYRNVIYEQLKENRKWSKHCDCRLDIQFQTVHTVAAFYALQRRVRLDTLDDYLFHAGL